MLLNCCTAGVREALISVNEPGCQCDYPCRSKASSHGRDQSTRYEHLSPFEIKDDLIRLARTSGQATAHIFLNGLLAVRSSLGVNLRFSVRLRGIFLSWPDHRAAPPTGAVKDRMATGHREAARSVLCAGHVQQPGGESPLCNLMEVKHE